MSLKLFEDAEHTRVYRKVRPSYPKELIEKIVNFLKEKNKGPYELAIDVGCGNGQATHLYSSYFQNVNGYDVSENQIKEANMTSKNDNVKFFVSPSETLQLDDNSVDLISVATAFHFFNIDLFFKESLRILKPNGVLAIFTYLWPKVSYKDKTEELSRITQNAIDFLGPYFAEEVAIATDGYKSVHPPYNEIERDIVFINELKWTIKHLLQFLASLSAYQIYNKNHPDNKYLEMIEMDIKSVLKDEDNIDNVELTVSFNIILMLCRKV